jgi:anhydro-N-acetylmuramic acid kinase
MLGSPQCLGDFLSMFKATPDKLVLGMMSGTSFDGVDVAVVKCCNHGDGYNLESLHSYPYPATIVEKLRLSARMDIGSLAELNVILGKYFGECARKTIVDLNEEVALIGSHGQTIYHHSSMADRLRCTWQIADGDEIAVLAGVPVISDFRTKDIALGGQGAPLTPYGDWVLFKQLRGHTAVLNIGGIANLTFLASNSDGVIGFDTGPGNAPLDRLVRKLTNDSCLYDDGGRFAASGKVNTKLLQHLIEKDVYIKSAPPKSTGFEMYGDGFLEEVIGHWGNEITFDLLTTLTHFVAVSIAENIKSFAPFTISNLVVAGGGALNSYLIDQIRGLLGGAFRVDFSDQFGVPVKAREAMCFAIMAHDAVYGRVTSLPSVTGAVRSGVLGKLSTVK